MLNYGRLRTVAANMRRCGLSQILVSDDDSIFYLIGRRVKAPGALRRAADPRG